MRKTIFHILIASFLLVTGCVRYSDASSQQNFRFDFIPVLFTSGGARNNIEFADRRPPSLNASEAPESVPSAANDERFSQRPVSVLIQDVSVA